MLKPRNPIITTVLTLIAASACHRLPLSIGEGIDDVWNEPGGSGSGGTSAGGGTGGAPGLGECDATYLACLESGEDGTICRALFERCDVGTSGTGTGSGGAYPDGTGTAGTGGYPDGGYPDGTGAAGTGSGGYPDGTGAAGTGSGGAYPDGTGAAGRGGSPAGGGAAGAPGLDECNTTYVLCLESGELPEICRDELIRCELSQTDAGGAAGAPGEAGGGNAAGARN